MRMNIYKCPFSTDRYIDIDRSLHQYSYTRNLHVMYIHVICNYAHIICHSIITYESAFSLKGNGHWEISYFFKAHVHLKFVFSFSFTPHAPGQRGEHVDQVVHSKIMVPIAAYIKQITAKGTLSGTVVAQIHWDNSWEDGSGLTLAAPDSSSQPVNPGSYYSLYTNGSTDL